jgi:hypothetical protein
MGWRQSQDNCLYCKGKTIFVAYVDDGTLESPDKDQIEVELGIIRTKFHISVEGDISDYVGVNAFWTEDNKIRMTQPNIIRSVLQEPGFNEDTKAKSTPAYSSTVLKEGANLPKHNAEWNYQRVIGKLNFLCSSCRPEIECAVHQCAWFSADPRLNNTEAVQRIGRYLADTVQDGISMDPTIHSFEVYADADFGGLWDRESAQESPITSKSRTGYVILDAKCPIIWGSQLQNEIAMSTTEAVYLALSAALKYTIPSMRLTEEIQENLNLPMDAVPKVHCTLFEDNSGAVELAKVPTMRPRTKHTNPKYHHFRQHVFDGKIKIEQVSTTEQLADIFTKNLARELFLHFRKSIIGW